MKSNVLRICRGLACYACILSVWLIASCMPSLNSTSSGNTNPPGVPTGVRITGSTIATVSLQWNTVSGASSYTVYYTLDGSHPGPNNSTDYLSDITTASAVLSQIECSAGQPIEVAVTASNDNGESNASAMVACSTLVPTNVVVTPADSGKFAVTWSAVSGAASYNVYEQNSAIDSATGPTESSYGQEYTGKSSPFHWINAAKGHYYHFAISAVDASGNEGGLSLIGKAVAQ